MAHKTTKRRKIPAQAVQHLPALDLAQRYTILEALDYLRIGRAKLYEHIAADEITTITDGTRRYIPGTEIARLSRPPEAAR